MPIRNAETDIDRLVDWFKENAPDFVAECGVGQIESFATVVTHCNDIFLSVRVIERTSKVKADEALVELLLGAYNRQIISQMKKRGMLR